MRSVSEGIEADALEIIPVVLCCDENYLKHAGVTITSLLQNAKTSYAYDIYVVYCGDIASIDAHQWGQFKELFGNRISFNLTFVDESSLVYTKNITTGLYGVAALLRLALPEVDVFQKFKKILYLDCDIIAYDVTKLWQQPFTLDSGGEAMLIAVRDPGQRDGSCPEFLHPAGIYNFPNEEYINSGVLVMDLDKLRNFNFTNKTFAFIEKHTPTRPDQDAINIVCQGNIKMLGYEYSWPSAFDKNTYRVYLKQYVGPSKPWTRITRIPASVQEAKNLSEYHYYKQISSFRNDRVDIAFCVTGKCFEAACIVATSVLLHGNPQTHYYIHVVHGHGYREATIDKFKSLQERLKNCTIFFVHYDAKPLAESFTHRKINDGKLLKILLPDILKTQNRRFDLAGLKELCRALRYLCLH